MKKYDYIIIGAGLYGVHTAAILSKGKYRVLIIEIDNEIFSRATYINQARLHNGYHYPRSMSTAEKSIRYFNRFYKDFKFAINDQIEKIYAISSVYSYTYKDAFATFCKNAGIRCDNIDIKKYFNDTFIEAAFLTKEFSFDAIKIKRYYLDTLRKQDVEIKYSSTIKTIIKESSTYLVQLENGELLVTNGIINTTYASINQILKMMDEQPLMVKYEICEMILCKSPPIIHNTGLTVMDGPFFSYMPFGFPGYHSLTSVSFTPHAVSFDQEPTFECQNINNKCSSRILQNCNTCHAKPDTSFYMMKKIAKKYLKDEIPIEYEASLFAIKPILRTSEIDDSRPTVIIKHSEEPFSISVLSGKINTFYDIDEFLYEESGIIDNNPHF